VPQGRRVKRDKAERQRKERRINYPLLHEHHVLKGRLFLRSAFPRLFAVKRHGCGCILSVVTAMDDRRFLNAGLSAGSALARYQRLLN